MKSKKHSKKKKTNKKLIYIPDKEKIERGTLRVGEPHPAAFRAKEYIASLELQNLMMYLGSFSSCALAGNRLAEICSETLDRLINGKPVSDRYLLGLAWTIKSMEKE